MQRSTSDVIPVCGVCDKMHLTSYGRPACLDHKTKLDGLGQLVPCKRAPADGFEICAAHGAHGPMGNKVSIERRREFDKRRHAGKTLRIFGVPRAVDPAQGLIEEYWRSAGIVAGLEAKVVEMDEAELVWGVVSEDTKAERPSGTDDELARIIGLDAMPTVEVKTARAAKPSVWLKMFNEERDRFTKLGIAIVSLQLEARRDEYIHAQVETFASVLLDPELGLTAEQRVIAAAKLRALGHRPKPATIEAQLIDAS